ncbi:Uncharacterized protein cpbgf_1003890 [Cryptosporidium parvum]|uniref:Uncharacterized protein n=1 Tax=Cryptosporidium parvum TaxID=5807 RepID=A0A7S7RHQ3_CRYPV|nr:Uncharacterized protein CPATCC_0039440 [Cryptosporidium parvum]WRK30389.1 Uncharacterized protein cpbgf_1003890 [Cryptosporidium parvum]|eukprot:QOY43632.1 hypothetical protein CPATCC_000443 [Cryptosporidium parvum]
MILIINTINDTINNNYLVAITQGNELLTFPFLNKYNITLNCNKVYPYPFNYYHLTKNYGPKSDFEALRIIFYNNINKNFLIGKIYCESKLILDVEDNKYRLTPIKNNNNNNNNTNFMDIYKVNSIVAKYYSYQLKEIPEIPKYLRDFNEEIIKLEDIINFVKKQEEKEEELEYIDNLNNKIIFKEFYNNGGKYLSYKDYLNKNKISFGIFEYNDDINNNHYYIGVPIENKCKCTIINNIIIDNECEKISYQYNIEKNILKINGMEFLTKNLFGVKILMNNSLEELYKDIQKNCMEELRRLRQ